MVMRLRPVKVGSLTEHWDFVEKFLILNIETGAIYCQSLSQHWDHYWKILVLLSSFISYFSLIEVCDISVQTLFFPTDAWTLSTGNKDFWQEMSKKPSKWRIISNKYHSFPSKYSFTSCQRWYKHFKRVDISSSLAKNFYFPQMKYAIVSHVRRMPQ